MSIKWRKKQLHINLKVHIILFLCTFFAGVLLINLRWTDESFWLGYQAEYALKQMEIREISRSAFLKFLLKNRLPIWTALCFFSCFYRGEYVLSAFSGWSGFSLGILSATFTQQYSLSGILLTGTVLIPQIFAYLPVYTVVIRNKIKHSPVCILKYTLLSGILLIGAAGEYFLNPWFLQKIYTVIHVFSHNMP